MGIQATMPLNGSWKMRLKSVIMAGAMFWASLSLEWKKCGAKWMDIILKVNTINSAINQSINKSILKVAGFTMVM